MAKKQARYESNRENLERNEGLSVTLFVPLSSSERFWRHDQSLIQLVQTETESMPQCVKLL
jgi:hypothetical protein